jgi:hypothetical protein
MLLPDVASLSGVVRSLADGVSRDSLMGAV